MKTLVRIVAYLVFAVGLAASIASTWTTTHLADEAGFVENAAAIGSDDQVRRTVVNVASAQFAAKIPLGPAISTQVASVTSKALTKVINAPEFDSAWNDSMRRTHQIQFSSGTAPEILTVDLAPFVDLAIDQNALLSNLGVSAPDQVLVTVGDVKVNQYVGLITAAAEKRLLAIAVTVIAGLVALFASPQRRLGSTLAVLGTLAVLVTLVSAIAARTASTWAVNQVLASHREWAGIVRPIGDIAVESMDAMLVPIGAAGLLAAAAGSVWRAISARQR